MKMNLKCFCVVLLYGSMKADFLEGDVAYFYFTLTMCSGILNDKCPF